jgi:YHS domain-containing protein
MVRKLVILGGLGVALATVAVVGCNNAQPPAEKAAAPQGGDPKPGSGNKEEDHGHKPGAHGGIIVSLGRDSYHAEAVFEKGRKVRLYMLGKEETRVQEVDAQELSAFVTADGSTEAVPVVFKPEPQQGDAKGKTSLFVATLPEDMAGKKVQITINNITVGGERFRIGFGNEVLAHADSMPVKKTTEEERKLFLTPGGLYTAADVEANGKTIPAVKYNGIRPTHDSHPKPGQKICPISETVSNPKFTWVIAGKTYEFCCIPCIEEFLATAKEKPAEIKDPSAYVKK